jgi:hypothetical protein
MKTPNVLMATAAALAVLVWSYPQTSSSQTILSRQEAAQKLAVQNLAIRDDAVSGQVVNQSVHHVGDVQLRISHVWHWNNEFRPGTNDLGRTIYFTLEDEIAPAGTMDFTFKAATPPPRSDGAFETTVSVAGFTTIIPQ